MTAHPHLTWLLASLLVMQHEVAPDGTAYVDHPADPGGVTNFGISLRFLRQLKSPSSKGSAFALGDIDQDGDIDADDIDGLDIHGALELYFSEFWTPHNIKNLRPAVAIKVMDMAVNMGPRQAVIILQRSINLLNSRSAGSTTGLLLDGSLGPKTLSAAGGPHSARAVIAAIREQAGAFYVGLVAQNSDFKVFKEGWLNRASV